MLKDHYQSLMKDELAPRLRELVRKLDEQTIYEIVSGEREIK